MSGQSAGKVKYRETNNYKQGRTGGKVKTINGPAVGNTRQGNPTKKGGIFRPTKGKA